MSDTDMAAAHTTLIVTPRERFGLAVRSLKSIVGTTSGPYKLVYIDGNSPRTVARELQAICEREGFTYVRRDRYLSPNQARNLGLSHADTKLVTFIDNDVIVSDGWLQALERCAEETGAEVICPLTCQREPLHTEVHQAGGEITADLSSFFGGSPAERRLIDRHILQGKPVERVSSERADVQACEFHCVMVRRDVFDRLGPLDERLLATKEHLDFSLSVWASGGRVMMEPRSVVTYLFPAGANKLQVSDWPYFALRWSPVWLSRSLAHFQSKWELEDDPYFARRAHMLDWRHVEGIVRPTLKKIPFLPRSGKVAKAFAWAGKRTLDLWSRFMAKRHGPQPTASVETRKPARPQLAGNISAQRFPVHS